MKGKYNKMKIIKMVNKLLIYEMLFIITCFGSLYVYFSYTLEQPVLLTLSAIIMIVLIKIFSKQLEDDKKIYVNKKAILLFIIIYTIMVILIISFNKFLSLNSNSVNQVKLLYILLLQAVITSTIFLSYIFGISLKEYNWKISFKWISIIFLVYLAYKLSLNILILKNNSFSINNIFSISFVVKFVLYTLYKCLYPGLLEEVLYRGFLISGLKGLGITDWKCNIVQAIVFGIIHFLASGNYAWRVLLSTAAQTLMGYVLGTLYFKTKSLTPCILLHGLINAI